MSERIIVGYDGTKPSAAAVLWAAHEAACRKVPLRIVSCSDIPLGCKNGFDWASADSINDLLEATDLRLQQVRDMVMHAHPSATVTTTASTEPAAIAMLDDLSADDLVVLGASRHQGNAAFWLGSTSRVLIRRSPCPLVIVHGPGSRGPSDRVVVGIDGSAASDRALEWAALEADLHHAPLVVVHVWRQPSSFAENVRSQPCELTQLEAECVLDRAVGRARERCGSAVTGQLVEAGSATALMGATCDGDLLVVGSHGRGAIVSGIIGSTVNTLTERSPVPVVVIRGHA